MSANFMTTARELASEVRASEQDLDRVLARKAHLVARLLESRCDHGIPALKARVAVEKAFEALAHGAQARGSLLDMHADLASLNVRELAVGDLSECPEPWGKAELTVVASQAA